MSTPVAAPRKSATVRRGMSDSTDLRNLLFAISEEFPMVISVNLTRNTYTMLEYKNFATKKAAAGGVFDDLIEVGASTVDPMHRQLFIDTLSRRSLLAAYAAGKKKVELDVRQLRDNGQYGWVKTTVIFLSNEESDEVLEITLAQPIEEEKEKELDNMRLRAVVDMALLASYEYIGIVNIQTGQFEMVAGKSNNSQRLSPRGDYGKTLMVVRDTMVPAEDREEYYKRLKLSNVILGLKAGGGQYRYRYRLDDTPERRWRETAYYTCPPNEDEILQTVRDVHDEVLAEQNLRMQEMLRRNEERQQLLTGLGFDVIIDLDLLTQRAEVLGETRTLLNRDINCENFPFGEIEAGTVHPDDLHIVMDMIGRWETERSFSFDFRFKHGDGHFFWCRCRAVMLQGDDGAPYRCIMKLTDIEEQKRSEQKLLYKAQRDSLTGLYNSMTMEMLVDDYLLSEEGRAGRHALMVIDLDDFKRVNDNWGHKTGDMVLNSFAAMLNASFRFSDVIGRAGGDEFVVFMKYTEPPGAVMESAHKFLKRLKSVQVTEGETYTPACSIGVSMFPEHGATYSELFRLADAAMYAIKEGGKNAVMMHQSVSTG